MGTEWSLIHWQDEKGRVPNSVCNPETLAEHAHMGARSQQLPQNKALRENLVLQQIYISCKLIYNYTIFESPHPI